MKKIKVLVVDDSALVRQALTTILNADPGIEVINIASDPYVAITKIRNQEPDVITLDLHMPRMDGLTFLKKLMAQRPIPVVVISSLTTEGSRTAMKAFEYGAIQVLKKPDLTLDASANENNIRICDAVKAASQARLTKVKKVLSLSLNQEAPGLPTPPIHSGKLGEPSKEIIVIGASVGGTEALKVILHGIPPDSPGIIVVQHMPEGFTRTYAEALDHAFDVHVKEAEDGEFITKGKVLIAEGDHHLLLKKRGIRYQVELKKGALVNRHRPSVDVLFRTVSRCVGKDAVGVLLTGMGSDGAKGLLEMKQAGAYTIAQDESSCVVFGMPQEAIKLGAVDTVLPIDQISSHLMSYLQKKKRKE